MSKYTNEFKLKVVKYCLEENHSQGEAEKYFNRLTNADFIDEELEIEYIKRNGKVVVDKY